MIWALFDFGVGGVIYGVLRVVAALLAGVIGWVVMPLLVRLLVRLAFHKKLPDYAATSAKVMGGVLFAVLVFLYLPLGSGSGPGTGPGGSGNGSASNGKGPGDKVIKDKAISDKIVKDKADSKPPPKDVLPIEVLGGARYKGGGYFYLIHGKEPALKLSDVDEFLKKTKGSWRMVRIVLTRDTREDDRGGPVVRLKDMVVQEPHRLLWEMHEVK